MKIIKYGAIAAALFFGFLLFIFGIFVVIGLMQPKEAKPEQLSSEVPKQEPVAVRLSKLLNDEVTVQNVRLGTKLKDFKGMTENRVITNVTAKDFNSPSQFLLDKYGIKDYFILADCKCFTYDGGSPASALLGLRLSATALDGITIPDGGDLSNRDREILAIRLPEQELGFVFLGTGLYDQATDEEFLTMIKKKHKFAEQPISAEFNAFNQTRRLYFSYFFDDYKLSRTYIKQGIILDGDINILTGVYYFSSKVALSLKMIRQDILHEREKALEKEQR